MTRADSVPRAALSLRPSFAGAASAGPVFSVVLCRRRPHFAAGAQNHDFYGVIPCFARLHFPSRLSRQPPVGSVAVTGLASGENLIGIDIRPADGKLWSLGDKGNPYTIEPGTGAATLKVALRAAAARRSRASR